MVTFKTIMFRVRTFRLAFVSALIGGLFAAGGVVSVSALSGGVDPVSHYAWSENVGWIDFGVSQGNVRIGDTVLTGYAWGPAVGWISLNCSNTDSCATVDYKVANDRGMLSGYAWSENLGWINFRPSDNLRVTIGGAGEFSGYAWGPAVGWISFNCLNSNSCGSVAYAVASDWNPNTASVSASSSPAAVQSHGGSRGTPAQQVARIAKAKQTIFARYGEHMQMQAVVITSPVTPPPSENSASSRSRVPRQIRTIARQPVSSSSVSSVSSSASRPFRVIARARSSAVSSVSSSSRAFVSGKISSSSVASSAFSVSSVSSASSVSAPVSPINLPPSSAPPAVAVEPRSVAHERSVVIDDIAKRRNRLIAYVDGKQVIYKDVLADAWYSPYVSYVVEEKIAQGYRDENGKPKGEFGVADPVTYAQVLKMALEITGQPLRTLPPPRNASARGTWASPYVAQAESMHLSVFTPQLDVNASATRAAALQTILEAVGTLVGRQPGNFSDLPPDHPYANAIGMASFLGIIDGDKDSDGQPRGTVRPDDPINRAEIAKIIALMKELRK